MKDSVSSYIEHLFNEFSYINQENSPCQGIENVSILVNKKRWKKRKKKNVIEPAQHLPIAFRFCNKQDNITRHSSMPELSECTKQVPLRNKTEHGDDTKQTKINQSAFQSKFIANVVSEHRFDTWFLNPFSYPSQTKWKIYRCQLGAVEDSCCCSCNSDAMFEVMKGLYDCYKAKNCDGCDCVLCGYKTAEERKLAEMRKSMTSVARNKILENKTPEEKEFIIRQMAKTRQPLPSGNTPSEKSLIDQIRKELGLPPSPKTPSQKAKMRKAEAAGIITPLEGKTPQQKEDILRAQADMGLPLPEGRTDSEKALIAKVKAMKKRPLKTDLLTPLTGKTPEEKENILRGRAMKGLPLPEGQSASEKKLIDKVRRDLGLPKDPTTKSMKNKHDQAAKAGLLQPLEGKTPAEKEKILKGLRSLGIPLPEGRTPSEKALIAKVKASPRSLVAPSEQLRRAKAEGLLTPLAGKTPEEKERILRGLAMKGLPLPEAASPSEKKLIDKVRADLGLPKEPDTKSMKTKYEQAAKAGLLQPLEGLTPEEKEKTLKGLQDLGIPLPEGRTPSEKALISKVKSMPPAGSIKTEGIMTPLAGKSPELKEKVLRARAKKGIPLPEGTTPSEKKIIEKVRADLGLPKEPDTKSMKAKHEQAAKAGLLVPLEGKTPAQKEAQLKGLRDMGIPLPEGRTPSEKALIAKIKAAPRSLVSPSEQWRRAKAEGLITPLAGKTPAQKEKILKGLAMKGLALPVGKTPSEKKLIDKVRDELGLPKEPDTKSMADKHEKAAKAGLLQPLAGKTPEEKERILQGQHDLGIPLPEGRTPSEKALIAKIKAVPAGSIKTAGVMTPLTGKTPLQKEKVLRARAKKGIPLPEGTTPSEKKLIEKVRADLGLPKEPDTKSMKAKHEQAAKAGLLEPLEGKTPAQKEALLKGLRDMGIPLPEGRTPSEKALVAKIKGAPRSMVSPSEQLRRAKAEGLMTPLAGKTPAQKEKILKGLAMKGIPLPEGKTPSEKKLIDKVREDLGVPKEPDTKSMKDKYEQAAKAGLLQPLAGKTPEEKEKILQGQHDLGIPLPEGRTPSEKALIAKIKASPPAGSIKTAGIMTPLAGKSPAVKEKVLRARAKRGIPLPEGTTPSEKKLIDKVRADLGLPKEPDTKSMKAKHELAAKAGLLEPLEGKTPAQKEAQLKGLRDMGIPLPEGRTPSEKALIAKIKGAPRSMVSPSEQLRRAKAEGLMTPLAGKTPAQKERILKGLAMKGIPLPEGKSPSEKKIIDKVRDDLGLPKEPDTKSMKDKYEQAAKAGLLQPLAGKTPEEKERILQGQYDLGIPLPEGRTPSEKALIAKIKAVPAGSIKTAGVMTPLKGKSPVQKEKILRARAKKGIPLPEGTTPSEKKLVEKVRADLGLPKEPDTKSMKAKHELAAKAGLLEPLEGKTPAQKEAQLKGLRDMGIPLPEGRTPSEKALIAKIKAAPRSMVSPSEQLRRAKAEGLMTPLAGKTPAQKEKILKGLAMKGIPLPEGTSPSEKKLIDKVRDDLGIPKEPDTKSMKDKYEQAAKAGLLQPLAGKTPEEKERILQGQYDLGIPLPEGRTPSEKKLIAKIKASPAGSIKTAGVMTPLKGKSPVQKEKVLRARAKRGIPLPEGTTPSEKKIIDKVRADLGLPKEPDTKSMKAKHEQAAKAGLLEPLEGKTPAQKEALLKGLRDMGIPLPEGRTPSEKALIAKIKGAPRSMVSPSEQLRRAKAEGLMTPLAGKTPAQKEKILKGRAMKGIPLPEGTTPSEKKLIDKVRDDLGIPKEPDTKAMKDKYQQAAKAGLLQPLAGKTPEEKEKILQGLHNFGIPLPEGRTPSEKALVAKVKASPRAAVKPSEQLRRAKAEGLLTPLKGKTPEEKENIIRGLAMKGLPLPIPRTPSEKKLVNKVRAELGLPKEPTSKALRDKHEKAAKAGLLMPLEGMTPEEKEKTLLGLKKLGIPLPEGRTPSEKALIAKVKAARAESAATITTEKLEQAKEDGLLTPLAGKTPEQKEDILRGLAKTGLPLPIGKTPSEKSLIKKIKEEFDIVDRTPSEKLRRAKDTGLLTPLEGKTPAQREKILRGRAAAGLPLPVARTPSEKALINKIKAETGYVTPSPAERLKRARAAGLLTPLEGKDHKEKEKILKGLAEAGLPLPVGKTKSEKSMIAKIKARTPPTGTTPSEKSIISKAKAAGLFTPITGKPRAEKERILKGLADAGLPLPEGKTASEKNLVKKIRAQAGLPPEPTPSEKQGKIRKKGKIVGVSASKKPVGIDAEEIEEIVKTTKCDRACGCDRKKIRFKHSYVKIRVTSPDISSFCDCPDECLPGVKAGAFIDNEGIKVTVGSAVGIPSYSMVCINDKMVSNTDLSIAQTNYYNNINIKNSKYKFSSFESGLNNKSNKVNIKLNVSSSDMSYSTKLYNSHSEHNYVHSRIARYRGKTNKSEQILESFKDRLSLADIYKKPTSKTKSSSSFETILIIRNDMSLSTSTSNSLGSISMTSNMDSSITSSSAHYSGYQSTNDFLSINSLDGPSTSDDYIDRPTIKERNAFRNVGAAIPQQYTVLRMSQLEDTFGNIMKNKGIYMKDSETKDPVVLFHHVPSKLDVSKTMLKIMGRKRFADASSIFVVVPKSEDEGEEVSSNGSMTSTRSSDRHVTANATGVMAAGKTVSWFRCKKSTESSECSILQSFESSCSPVPPRRRRLHECSQLHQTAKSPSLSDCSPAGNVKRNRLAKVQKASIESTRHDSGMVPKNTGVAWFGWGLRMASASSSLPECNIPVCSNRSSSFVPSYYSRDHGRNQQHQTPVSTASWVCLSDLAERTRNLSAKIGRSWFRLPGARKDFVASDVPPSRDFRFCPTPVPSNFKKKPPSLKVTKKPSAKEGKSFSWFRLPRKCRIFPASDSPSSSEHSRYLCRGKENHSNKNQLDDLEINKNRPAKVQKPSIKSARRVGQTKAKNTGMSISWFRFPSSCKVPTASDAPTCDPCLPCHSKPPVLRNLCFKEEKQSAEMIDSETTPKISGILKWLSWTRILSTRKKSAPSIPMSGVTQFFDSSSSPMQPVQPHHQGRNQQNQTVASPCVSPRAEFKVKRNRSAKVQKPSIQSIYQEGETTWQVPGVNLNGPSLASKHTSVPSIMMYGVPTYIDSSCSPVPPNQTYHHGRNEQNQSSAAPSLSAYPPDEQKVKRNRSGVSLSWSRIPWLSLPSKRKTSTPSIKTCDVPQYVDSSSSPVLPYQPHHQGYNELCQTSAISFFACPPDDWKEKRNPTAKVQKPSIESIYHEGETTSNINGVTLSFIRLPSKRKTYLPPITSSGVQRCPHLYGRNEQKQTLKPLHGYPTQDSEVMRNPSAKVQKPFIETVRRGDEPALKKAGIASGWFRLPSMRAPSIFPNKPKNMENFKGSEPKPNTLNLSVSNSELGDQLMSEQIFQLQLMSAIKQKYSREICCLFRKQNSIPQPKLAKEKVKIPDIIDQRPAKSIKEAAPVPQKLARIKTIQQKGDKLMSTNNLKSPKNLRLPKTERQSKENKPKLNTVTLSNSKPETYLPMSRQIPQPQKKSQIKKKEFCTICRPCPEQDQMPEPVLAKKIVKLSNPIDQQPEKLANKISSVEQQTDVAVVCECNEDKPMTPQDLKNPKTSEQKEKVLISEYKEDSLKDLENSKTSKQKQKVPEQLTKLQRKRYPPQLPPDILELSPLETPEGIGPCCKCLDTRDIKKLRSELAQSTSVLNACKRKNLQKVQVFDNAIELDFADAIRYFATLNPERFQQLMEEVLDSQLKAEENKRKQEKTLEKQMEKVRKKSEKEAKIGKKDKTTITELPISDESECDYLQGFKFSCAAKSGPTGTAGVDCSKIHSRSR